MAEIPVFARLAAAQIRGQAQYRLSFGVDLAAQTAVTVLDFVTILVFFNVTPALGGFSVYEVLLMAALGVSGFAVADLLVGTVELLRVYVRSGLLDAMLVRPRRVLPQLLAVDFQPRRFGRATFAFVVLAVVLGKLDVDWTWERAALLVVTPIAGVFFFCGLFVATASAAFWWIDSGEFANSVTYGGRDFTSYPLTVFGGAFRRLFGYGLGFGFVAYYPALALLGKPDPLGLPAAAGWGAVPAAALTCTAAWLLWRTGIRHYKGTGS